MRQLENKVAIITGGGSGIGKAAALAFAREGAKVVIAGRGRDALDAVVAKIGEGGGDAIAQTADVSNSDQVQAMIAAAVGRFGKLDCIFSNAGMLGGFAPIADMNEGAFDELIATNLKGTWLCLKYAVEAMRMAGTPGAIVSTSSYLSQAGTPGYSVYSASKAGIDALTRTLAMELGEHGIRVNTVNPGVIATPMSDGMPDKVREQLEQQAALHRLGAPEDIASAAVWLCSDAASFITGQSILVDGGFNIPGPR